MKRFDPDTSSAEIHADDGYRPNVGIVLLNQLNQVFWARRSGHDGWQFPQGGVRRNETVEDALFRELYEEVGLKRRHVTIVGHTRSWLHYDLPEEYLRRIRSRGNRKFRGQKQVWYLLRLIGEDSAVSLDNSSKPEFDKWVWTDWWTAVEEIVEFKREVYEMVWEELCRYLPAHPLFEPSGYLRR